MTKQRSILVVDDGTDSAESVAQWAESFARVRGARSITAPRGAPTTIVLDIAGKEDVTWIASGLRCEGDSVDIDGERAALMRRAPCPVWTVQPWAASAAAECRVAIVGVDPAHEAQSAAHATASILRESRSRARLFLVHGLEMHPAEMAAKRPWAQITASMQLENHPWIEQLARELAGPELLVSPIVQPIWAPELIGGVARCQEAHFIALGSRWCSEAKEARASNLVRRVVRSTPCPMLTV